MFLIPGQWQVVVGLVWQVINKTGGKKPGWLVTSLGCGLCGMAAWLWSLQGGERIPPEVVITQAALLYGGITGAYTAMKPVESVPLGRGPAAALILALAGSCVLVTAAAGQPPPTIPDSLSAGELVREAAKDVGRTATWIGWGLAQALITRLLGKLF